VPLWQPASVIFEYLCYIVCVSEANKYSQPVSQSVAALPVPDNAQRMNQLEEKYSYSLESTDPRESEIRAPSQPLPYLKLIPPNTLFITNSTY